MSKRGATRLAWFAWSLCLVIVSADVVLAYLDDPTGLLSNVFGALVTLAFPTVGVLIISRRPENLIGWLLGGGMLVSAIGSLALDYAVYTLLTAPHSLPGGEWMLWFGAWARSLGFFSLIAFVPLLFPNGKVPSPRWRPVTWFAIGEVVLFTIVEGMLAPTNQSELRLPPLPNPLGITIQDQFYGPLSGIGFLGMFALTLLVAASLVVRFRHAKSEERQQLKWFAYAGVFAVVVLIFLLLGMLLLPPAIMENAGLLFELILAGFPVAVGIAILRYRLYDIDLIIRRTLIYSILTAILALVYLGSVVVLQESICTFTGQGSDVAIVVSTLSIAALFNPLRHRVQGTIDHRFYRRKYDAQKVLAAFGMTVRDEVELEKLEDHLVEVVQETMRPARASVWLKPTPDKRRRLGVDK